MVSNSEEIPTKGKLGSGLWQAVKGLLFEGVAPSLVDRPDTVTLSIEQRTATFSITQRTATMSILQRNISLEVIE